MTAGLQVPYRGIIEIVGDHDVGKTIAALQVVYPYKKTVFVDDDIKGDATVQQMREAGTEFEQYINLGEMRRTLGKTPTADQLMEEVVDPTIENIISKKHDAIIWDTWRIVYESARIHVDRNQNKYNKVVNFRGNSQIIQGLVSKVARMIERDYLEALKDSCDLLVITHHVKDNWVGGVSVGKIPESSRTFNEICNMRMWLRRNPMSKVPIILFLKRPSLPKPGKSGRPKFVNVVPLKVTPTDKDNSIWDALERYEENPFESRNPRFDETPTPEELATISGTLTLEQRQYVEMMMKYNQEVADELGSALKDNSEEPDKVPANGIQLITMSMSRYHMDNAGLNKLLGKTTEQIVQFTADETEEAWEKVKENG